MHDVKASHCSHMIGACRSFETQLSRVEAELLRREAPPSYGQLIAQGLIPPVEDFPVCSGSQASVLENLRLAVRSQLGFTSLQLPSSGCHSNLWRRLFTFSRSRRSGSLALVSADPEDSAGSGSTGSSSSDLLNPDSDDTDTEGERGRERECSVGAVGGAIASLPQKTPPSSAVEAIVSVTSMPTVTTTLSRDRGQERQREAHHPSSLAPVSIVTSSLDTECHSDASDVLASPTSALQRLAHNLHRLARNLTRTNQNANQNHSPLRQLDIGGRGGGGGGGGGIGTGSAEGGERRGSRDEEDVELLIPVSDSDSSSSSSLRNEICQPLLESHPSSVTSHAPLHHHGTGSHGGRDGPCEHCGMVHTAQIPDTCLEATGKPESSDDELLLLC
ncbi:hypothetical protein LDENG_00221380 [Lucifuga dentata]|nr:hypothetical protein LDENG_00221380 [Lucifuga dentata]